MVRYAPIRARRHPTTKDTMPIYDMATSAARACSSGMVCRPAFVENAADIHCNVYFADTPEDFDLYFGMGIDTILTNRMDIARSYREKK